jgi:glycogen debranching enzyme
MDTNYPAGTPREGYPVEIQVLWWRLVKQLARWNSPPPAAGPSWTDLATRIEASVERLFWLPDQGWYADVLAAGPGIPAAQATPVNALRSNALSLISLGWVRGERARRLVTAAARHLVVPGALRSLAPLPVEPPQPIHAADGRLLNDPPRPYWPRYEGDEDSRRKPAYHNGTAWLWPFPAFCEAWALAWDNHPDAVATACAYLRSSERWLHLGCLGQLPEICDGDAPHTPRGCDAQAWSASEALRVWRWLRTHELRALL